MARTARRCGPSASAEVVYGEEQLSGEAPSTLHSRPADGSDAENSKVGVGSFVAAGSCGPELKVTLGPGAGSACARAGSMGAPAASSAAIDAAIMSRP